jgi:hypothetical protein
LEEEGIEEIKMYLSDVRGKYAFLYPVIKDICPRAFEPPDYELQTRIIQDDLEKGKAEVRLARKRMRIYYICYHVGTWDLDCETTTIDLLARKVING